MRYLDINKTIKAFEEQHGSESTLLNGYNADWILSFIESQPTADVQEVRHGRWISNDLGGYKWAYYCSECGWVDGYPFNDRHKYCPHCGAKMDGEWETDTNKG